MTELSEDNLVGSGDEKIGSVWHLVIDFTTYASQDGEPVGAGRRASGVFGASRG